MKQVKTKDLQGKPNGWLMELKKDGNKTTAYLTAVDGFKGYHLHRKREANYVCLKGKVQVETYERIKDGWFLNVVILNPGDDYHIPINRPTGISNIGEEAWLINFPEPAYDPEDHDEQVEYTLEEINNNIVK